MVHTYSLVNMSKFLLTLLYVFYYLEVIYSKNCNQNDRCSCTFDDGSGTMDLSKVGLQGGVPLFKDILAYDGYLYSFNPCYPFDEGTCFNAAGCQMDSNAEPVLYYNIGDSDKVTFFFDGSNVIGIYKADDNFRSSVVTYICDPGTPSPIMQANGEDPPGQPSYSFTITGADICPQKEPPRTTDGPSPTDKPSGKITASVEISTGTVITIVFFSIVLVYLVAGVLFNRLYRKENGRDMIPNVTFWTVLPGLIKDGFGFTFSKIRRKEYQAI